MGNPRHAPAAGRLAFTGGFWGTANEQVAAAIVLVVAFIVSVAMLFLYSIEPAPENARVLADGERRTYASTPCVIFNKLERELIVNRHEVDDPQKPLQLQPYANEVGIGEVRNLKGWRRDQTCNYINGYDQIVTVLDRLLGYRSRWTPEGQWRW